MVGQEPADQKPAISVGHPTPSNNRREAVGFALRESRLLWFAGFAVLLTLSFLYPLVLLVHSTVQSSLNSYILLVPFISGYLFYIRRKQLPDRYKFSPGWAIIPLCGGLAALTAAFMKGASLQRDDYLSLMTLSFVCLLAAGGLFFLGKQWMAAASFPFAFLIFMVPMPPAIAATVETGLKLASSEAANLFFNMAGTPVLREGTFFQLPNILIQVAQECSGIRSSLILFITGLLAANLFLKSNWRRVVMVLFVIPLGILRNGFRVFVIGALCVHFGPQMIHSTLHRRGGPIFFALSLIPLFLLLWWLRRGEMARAKVAIQDRHETVSR
jgi:exosortase C (VPDSG-CTERM-specific)